MPLDPFFQQSHIFHRAFDKKPLHVVSADGLTLTLDSGRQVLDATGGPAVACLGHNQPEVADAVTKQLQTVSYLFSGGGYSERATEELAATILKDAPGGLSKAIFLNSGSEATDTTLKLIIQYWHAKGEPQRVNFIARKQSYHGNTIGGLCISGHKSRRAIYGNLLSKHVSFVDPCYAYRNKLSGETDAEYVQRLKQQLDDEFQARGPETVAAFFAETISGSTLACVPAVPGYFQAVQAVCDKYRALLVLDEVESCPPCVCVSMTDRSLPDHVRNGSKWHDARMATRGNPRSRHPNGRQVARWRIHSPLRCFGAPKGIRHRGERFPKSRRRPHVPGLYLCVSHSTGPCSRFDA